MTTRSTASAEQVAAIRGFNRFYTHRLGLLNQELLKSRFSLTEARILYELATRDDLTATDIRRDLSLDAGYLSRILKGFARRGLVRRKASGDDGRQLTLALTAAGRAAFEPLNQASHEEILAMLGRLSNGDADALVGAVRTAHRLLGGASPPKDPYLLRRLKVGDIGWITHRQGLLYFQEYGWDETFEALVAEILGEFVTNFDPQREKCWIAERNDEIVGAVFLVRGTGKVAKLRLLYVEPSARGLGIGRRLVKECITFARSTGYRTLTLWTNDVLTSARRIYQAAGFTLESEERHHSFGKDLVGQNWNLDLEKPF
jgi:DNA-binding MarR family transcriptional regulator/GNAT superfamily N-acetyltransferase